MALQKTIFIRRLNGFSWAIIIAFIASSFAMQYHTNSRFYEFFDILPLIILAIYWCEKSAHLINIPECKLEKKKLFKRDLSFIFSLLIIGLISSGDFQPHYITVPLIGSTETLYVITCALLMTHGLFASTCKIIRVFQLKTK